ncbi:Lrp/AsnC family transcriptional regulator [Nesterenkonia massiliensis]|uniref:Lrp/AsnC family transcriptional regulator n=1 Tax=Nesterenkonia massiliensis TaxID=1232429 RepID=A0ABT2HN59_9MICC|nr:Lrp/AsnC family transcriptional regulator [Nesterenkonia massiliensis]MCT1606120.1 Lrp/AsnC family transcriptional regulator [Nesterenkonia massiliensis]
MDSVDRAIIEVLRTEGRISNAALAQRVGLTPGPCLRRVQRLEADGVILGYAAQINPATLGQSFEVGVSIELKQGDQETVERFESTMAGFEEVLELLRLFGTPDYYARVAVADLNAYERFLTKKLLTIPGVSETNSAFPMKIIKSARPHPQTSSDD